jgi:excisionase family DNA binding protein
VKLLKPEELAERWQVPRSQVYRLSRDGRIPTVRIGRYYRYDEGAIEAYERGEAASVIPRAA